MRFSVEEDAESSVTELRYKIGVSENAHRGGDSASTSGRCGRILRSAGTAWLNAPSRGEPRFPSPRRVPVHSGHVGELAVVHYRWHPQFGEEIRIAHPKYRRGEDVAVFETPDRSHTVLPAWMLDAGVCTAMTLGSAPFPASQYGPSSAHNEQRFIAHATPDPHGAMLAGRVPALAAETRVSMTPGPIATTTSIRGQRVGTVVAVPVRRD